MRQNCVSQLLPAPQMSSNVLAVASVSPVSGCVMRTLTVKMPVMRVRSTVVTDPVIWRNISSAMSQVQCSAQLGTSFDSISRIKVCCLYFEHWSICQLFQLGRNLNIRKFIWRHLYPCQLGMWWWSWLWRWWPEWWTWRLYWDWVPWHPVHLWQIQMCPS